MESSSERCKKYVKNFLYEAGITSGRMVAGLVNCENLVAKLVAEKKFETEKEKESYILGVLGWDLGGVQIAEPEKYRMFDNWRLNRVYKSLVGRFSINFREEDMTYFEGIRCGFTEDVIIKMDELLELLSNSWPLQKTFTSLEDQNKKIEEIVKKEIEKILKESLIKEIVRQVEVQIIHKFKN